MSTKWRKYMYMKMCKQACSHTRKLHVHQSTCSNYHYIIMVKGLYYTFHIFVLLLHAPPPPHTQSALGNLNSGRAFDTGCKCVLQEKKLVLLTPPRCTCQVSEEVVSMAEDPAPGHSPPAGLELVTLNTQFI